MHAHVRVFGLLTIALLVAAGLQAAPAEASTRASSRYLLHHLVTGYEHPKGYDRDLFRHWVDVDGDGCDARDEVLISEAVTKPGVGAGCSLTGGVWRSKYDGATTRDSSTFDIAITWSRSTRLGSRERGGGTPRRGNASPTT